MAFEVSNLLTQATQLVAILTFILVIEPIYAAINLFVVLLILAIIGRFFAKQLKVQVELRVARDGKRARPQKRYGSRIKAAGQEHSSGLGIVIMLEFSSTLVIAGVSASQIPSLSSLEPGYKTDLYHQLRVP